MKPTDICKRCRYYVRWWSDVFYCDDNRDFSMGIRMENYMEAFKPPSYCPFRLEFLMASQREGC